MRARGPAGKEDFEATLAFVSYAAQTGSTRAVIYRNVETDETYRISNFAIERMIKLDQMRPVVTGTWTWSMQGYMEVIRPTNITYAGMELPA